MLEGWSHDVTTDGMCSSKYCCNSSVSFMTNIAFTTISNSSLIRIVVHMKVVLSLFTQVDITVGTGRKTNSCSKRWQY